jgi:hypothetical protein
MSTGRIAIILDRDVEHLALWLSGVRQQASAGVAAARDEHPGNESRRY